MDDCHKRFIFSPPTPAAPAHSFLSPTTTPPPSCRRLDPPANYFRIRLVCTLLNACGQYFTRGAARKKLDRFVPFFQRYLLSKPPLPLDMEFDVQVGAGVMWGWGWGWGSRVGASGGRRHGRVGAGAACGYSSGRWPRPQGHVRALGRQCCDCSAGRPAQPQALVPQPPSISPFFSPPWPHRLLQELWQRLKVRPPEFASYEAACQAVAEIEAREMAAAAAGGLAIIEEDEEEEQSDQEGSEDGASDGGSDADEEGGSSGEGEADEEEVGGEGAEEEEEEESAVRMLRPSSAAAELDPEFEREFAQLMLDFQGRPGPALAKAPPQLAGAAAAAGVGPGSTGAEPAAAAGGPTVAFRVMMRRGGKEDKTRELHIPLSAGMAQTLREKEEREAAEKAEMKRLVLEANQRELAAEQQAAALYHRPARGYYARRH